MNGHIKIALAVIVSAVIVSATDAATAKNTGIATITLAGEARVSESRLTLGDVAKISTASAGLASELKSLNLGQAPWAGQSLTVDAAQVRFRLRQAGIDPTTVSFPYPGRVRVVRAARIVSGDELNEAAKAAVQNAWTSADRMECQVLQKTPSVTVGEGLLEIVPAGSLACRPGMNTVSLDIRVNGTRERMVSVPVKITAYRQVVVTNNALARGQAVSASDLRVEEREITATTSDYLEDPVLAQDLRVVRSMPAGAALRKADLEVIPLVRRNGSVIVTAETGRVRIKANGVAMEDGLMGQLVRVKLDASSEIISAKVTASGQAQIGL